MREYELENGISVSFSALVVEPCDNIEQYRLNVMAGFIDSPMNQYPSVSLREIFLPSHLNPHDEGDLADALAECGWRLAGSERYDYGVGEVSVHLALEPHDWAQVAHDLVEFIADAERHAATGQLVRDAVLAAALANGAPREELRRGIGTAIVAGWDADLTADGNTDYNDYLEDHAAQRRQEAGREAEGLLLRAATAAGA